MLTRVVVVGAGRTSESIVDRVSRVAPVLVLDVDRQAVDVLAARLPERSAPAADAPFRHTVEVRLADATSKLTLEACRGEANDRVGFVAATSDDRVNLEAARLAQELGFSPTVAIANEAARAATYEALGARPIVKASVLGQAVERALLLEGLSIATTVGLGKGEILEFKVLPSSVAIGVPLHEIGAHGWRIAAIYRDGALVLPTGNTALAQEDSVLLVGDPRILPIVAENLRTGLPVFPRRHGPHVVAYMPEGRDSDVDAEATYYTKHTRARGLVRVEEGGEARTRAPTPHVSALVEPFDARDEKTFDSAPLGGTTFTEHVHALRSAQPGVVVARIPPRSIWDRLRGVAGRAGELCDALSCPLLFAKGATTPRRIVLAAGAVVADLTTADVAIDLARMFSLPLALVVAELPAFFGKPDGDAFVAAVEGRARVHQVDITTIRLEGNPIARIRAAVGPEDLIVVARPRGAKDSFTSPDISLRLARVAPCSTLVATVDDA